MPFGKDQNTGQGDIDPVAAGVAEISSSLFGDSEADPSPGDDLDDEADAPVGEQGAEGSAAETDDSADPAPQDDQPAGGEGEAEPPAGTDTAAPPKTWKKEAAAEWAKLPPSVQAEIHRREADIFKGIEQYREAAQVGQSFNKILQPYQGALQQAGVDPLQMVNAFAYNHMALSQGTPEQKLATARQLMTHYGIDLNQLAGGEANYTPTAEDYVDPEIKALRDEIAQLKGTFTQQSEASRKAEVQKMVDEFASDPANVYFEEVASEVAQLLQTGAAKDLKDAYEKAIYINPTTRAKEMARLQTEALDKANRERAEKLAKAKAATAANVQPGQTSRRPTAPVGSLDDTLAATMESIKLRS
jgi:hypothetical protein